MTELNEALQQFQWNGVATDAMRYGSGHINDTYI